MTDLSKTLAKYRLPLERDQMKQARAFAAPALRFAAKNPLMLIGAGVLALAGIVAFSNRKKIAATAAPMIEDAKTKGQALMGDAAAKGQELLEGARTKGEAVVEKVAGLTRDAQARLNPTDVH